MRQGLYYLNNVGSKWVVFDSEGKHEQQEWLTKSGKTI